jgi:hypothetical protein
MRVPAPQATMSEQTGLGPEFESETLPAMSPTNQPTSIRGTHKPHFYNSLFLLLNIHQEEILHLNH